MAYFTIYDVGAAEVTTGNPFDFGTLNRDTEEVSSWVYGLNKADSGLESSGNSTVTVTDASGADSSDLFQFAAWTAGDTTGPVATPGAYGADLTITSTIDNSTGVAFWVRRKAGPTKEPATDTTAVISATGTVIPVA